MVMRAPRSIVLPLLTAALLAAAPAPAGAATEWTAAASFPAGDDVQREPVPRAAIAADGTSALAFTSKSGALMLATAGAGRRFGAPRVVQRTGVGDYAIAAAPGGAFLLAWQDAGNLRVAVRTKAGRAVVRRHFASRPLSAISGVAVAADPKGGYALAERVFPGGSTGARRYRVRARSLDRAGRAVGPVQDLGGGQFGIDARPTQAIAVDGTGRAVLAFRRENPVSAPFGTPEPVLVSVRPHGGAFGAPVALAGPPAADPRVAVGSAGRAAVAFTQIASRGDAGVFGSPLLAGVRPDGSLTGAAGPRLANPRRAFAPSAAFTESGAAVLVFQLKAKPEAFSTEAPVRAVAVDSDGRVGPLQTLTSGRAKEPVAMPVGFGRVLAIWSGRRGIGAAIAHGDGTFKKTAEPKGPPPWSSHTNATNRDLRTAGRYAIFTWARGGRVRAAIRRF